MARPRGSTLSAEHKQALAEGREQSRKVRAYLDALEAEASQKRRGRKRSFEPLELSCQVPTFLEQLEALERRGIGKQALDGLEAGADRLRGGDAVDLDALRADFVSAAKGCAERKGTSYAAFREAGVPTEALKAAGITRGT